MVSPPLLLFQQFLDTLLHDHLRCQPRQVSCRPQPIRFHDTTAVLVDYREQLTHERFAGKGDREATNPGSKHFQRVRSLYYSCPRRTLHCISSACCSNADETMYKGSAKQFTHLPSQTRGPLYETLLYYS